MKIFTILNLLLVFIVMFTTSCGVETSSSQPQQVTQVDNSTNSATGSYSNPVVDDNSSTVIDSSSGTDSGTSSGTDSGTTSGTDSGTIINSDFDAVDAIEDTKACLLGDNNSGLTDKTIADTPFDNQGVMDEEHGIGVNSGFPYNDDASKTQVMVFYTTLKPARTFDVVSINGTNYRLDVDTGWATNDQKIIYVRTPPNTDNLYGCYRYDLSTIASSRTAIATKVYRNK